MNDAQKTLEKYANEFQGDFALDNNIVIELLDNDCVYTEDHGEEMQYWIQPDGSYISRTQDVYTFGNDVDVYNKTYCLG